MKHYTFMFHAENSALSTQITSANNLVTEITKWNRLYTMEWSCNKQEHDNVISNNVNAAICMHVLKIEGVLGGDGQTCQSGFALVSWYREYQIACSMLHLEILPSITDCYQFKRACASLFFLFEYVSHVQTMMTLVVGSLHSQKARSFSRYSSRRCGSLSRPAVYSRCFSAFVFFTFDIIWCLKTTHTQHKREWQWENVTE